MTDNGVVWEEPSYSPSRGVKGAWFKRLSPLCDHPLRWARVHVVSQTNSGEVTRLRRGAATIPAGRWEFTSRTLPDGRRGIYARYLGPEDGAS